MEEVYGKGAGARGASRPLGLQEAVQEVPWLRTEGMGKEGRGVGEQENLKFEIATKSGGAGYFSVWQHMQDMNSFSHVCMQEKGTMHSGQTLQM